MNVTVYSAKAICVSDRARVMCGSVQCGGELCQ